MSSGGDSGRIVGDRYRIDELVRSGEHVDEWSGHDLRLNRAVTIRILRADIDPASDHGRAVREHLRQAVRVEDPGLTRIYDSLEPHAIGLVSEPIEGGDLRAQIAEAGPMSLDRARSITIELAKTIDAVHREGVVHGGFTAESVGHTVDGRLVIRDLGTHATPTTSEDAVAEDVASIAALLHEASCGKPPHDRGRGRELDPSVPTAVAGLVEQAFSDDPPWPSAAHFAAALSNEPIEDQRSALAGERRWLVPAMVVLFIGGFIAVLGALAARSDVARDIFENAREAVGLEPEPPATSSTTQAPTPTTITPIVTTAPPAEIVELELLRITDFDPDGNDNSEHPERLVLINDGDPTRGWQTEIYTTRDFGRLKPGVGLVIELPDPATITQITVRSPTRGWSFDLFAAPGPPVGADWGDPIRTVSGIQSDTVLDIGELEAKSMLLWITDLGDGPTHRVTITDIEIDGFVETDAAT